jgi:uncharacterized membrane protein
LLLAQSNLKAWLSWLGYDLSGVPTEATGRFLWTNPLQSWEVFLFLAVLGLLAYGVVWLYLKENPSCPRSVRFLLIGLRLCVLLVLAVTFLGPAYEFSETRIIKPLFIVMRDVSHSMNREDDYLDESAAKATAASLGVTESELRGSKPTRVTVLNSIVSGNDEAFLQALAKKGRLKVIDFADVAQTVAGSRKEIPGNETAEEKTPGNSPPVTTTNVKNSSSRLIMPPAAADGRATDIQLAIAEALAEETPAAIFMFTDGQHTGQNNPLDVAAGSGESGVPIYPVGIGDPARPKNVKVVSVETRSKVWQGDPFEIVAEIATEDIAKTPLDVELVEHQLNEKGESIAESAVGKQRLDVKEVGAKLRVVFSRSSSNIGRYKYVAKVATVSGERDDKDNQGETATIEISSKDKIKVLLIAGAPNWDFRGVERLFSRDKNIVLNSWLQTLDPNRPQRFDEKDGAKQLEKLPRTRAELFEFDVVMLFDPNPDELDAEWVQLLKEFADEHGGGVLLCTGPKYSHLLLSDGRTAGLKDLIPVRLGDVSGEIAKLFVANRQPWPLGVVSANVDHSVMSFFPDRRNTLGRWEALPGVFWSFPAVAAKPATQTLLEHSDPTLRTEENRPLLVAGRYGAGQTLYMGFNGSWRWRSAGQQAEFFERFWIQVARYLVEGRTREGGSGGKLEAELTHYEIGEKVRLTARLKTESFEPLITEKINARVTVNGTSNKVDLIHQTDEPGTYVGTFKPRQTGRHTVELDTTSAVNLPTIEDSTFMVSLPSQEDAQTWMNQPLLTQIAVQSGGKYLQPNQVTKVAQEIDAPEEKFVVPGKTITLWDVWASLALLVALLGTEWGIRKWFKLV